MTKTILILAATAVVNSLYAQKFTDSLLLHVSTNSSTKDNSANAFAATATGVLYTTDSKNMANQAIAADGATTMVMYATANSKLQHNLPMTCAVWVNLNNTTGNNPVFYSSDNYTAYAGVWIQIINGYVYANVGDGVSNGTGNRYSVRSANVLSASTWYHICAIYHSATSIDLYINGVKVGATQTSGGGTTMGWNTTANANYGGSNTGTGTYAHFNGKLDNLTLWGRTLSVTEIKMHKNMLYFGEMGESPKDFGPGAIVATAATTGSEFDRLGNSGGSIVFNGTSDKVSLPTVANYKPTFPFTFSAWVFTIKPNGIRPIIASTDHFGGNYAGATLWLENGYPTMYIGDGTCKGATCRKTYTASDSIKSGQWNLVTAVVSDINTFKLYINGAPVSGGVLTGSGTVMDNNATIAGNIGYLTDAYGGTNYHFSGSIDEVMIINTELSAAEVSGLYAKSLYIKLQPTAISALNNSNVALTCVASGTEKVNYQWKKMKWGTGWQNASSTTSKLSFSALTATDTGYYLCTVFTGTASINSKAVSVDLTPAAGVANLRKDWSIFPNPTNHFLTIKTNSTGEMHVFISDILSKKLMDTKLNPWETGIDVSKLQSGTYIIHCKLGDVLLQPQKFIKN